jgi:hypothetical protein
MLAPANPSARADRNASHLSGGRFVVGVEERVATSGFEWSSVAAPAIAAVAVIITKMLDRGQSRTTSRDVIVKDLEIAGKLPDGDAKVALLADIERRSMRLATGSDKTRDPSGVVLGIILMVGGLVMAYFGWQNGSAVWRTALWTGAVVIFAIGAFGFAQDLTPYERDAKGRPIK